MKELVKELYKMIDDLDRMKSSERLKYFKGDGIGGQDMWAGVSPFSKQFQLLTMKYGDELREAFKTEEIELTLENIWNFADGIQFYPIFIPEKEIGFKIIREYTKDQFLLGVATPKSASRYWKNVQGNRLYFNLGDKI